MIKRLFVVLCASVLLTAPSYAQETGTDSGEAAQTETSPGGETTEPSELTEGAAESAKLTEGAAESAQMTGQAAESAELTERMAEIPKMSEEMLELVLEALGDENCFRTYEFLGKGEILSDGYRGEYGFGLQQMLADFGCNIKVDGAIGPMTIEALNQVQEAFGLKTTDKMDLDLYSRLLPMAFLAKEQKKTAVDEAKGAGAVADEANGTEAAADEAKGAEAAVDETKGAESGADRERSIKQALDLQEYYEKTGGTGYYEYLMACLLAAEGKYYSAKRAFEKCAYGDSTERAGSCVRKLPDSGELFHDPQITGTDTSLTFIVNVSDETRGMCFKVFNVEDRLASILFVKGSGKATVRIPAGIYHVIQGSGDEWYGSNETFGPDGKYAYLTFHNDAGSRYDANLEPGAYELEVNVAKISEGATSVGTSGVAWEDFPV